MGEDELMWWWSWLLMAVGVSGLWLARRRNRAGWAVGLAAQMLWLGYGASTGQYGFVLSAVVYGAVYARNLAAWRR